MYEKQNVPEVRLKCMLRDMPSICHIKTLITLVYLNNQWIYSTNTSGRCYAGAIKIRTLKAAEC